jgi:hypothetical protein
MNKKNVPVLLINAKIRKAYWSGSTEKMWPSFPHFLVTATVRETNLTETKHV